MITVNEPEGSIKVNKISDTFRTVPDTYAKNENAVPVPVEPEESVPVSTQHSTAALAPSSGEPCPASPGDRTGPSRPICNQFNSFQFFFQSSHPPSMDKLR